MNEASGSLMKERGTVRGSMLGAPSLPEVEWSEPNSTARGTRCDGCRVVVRHAALKSGTISIPVATDPSPSSQPMMDAIKEGVTHSKMGGDGMEGGDASAGSSERSPASLTRGVCRGLIH